MAKQTQKLKEKKPLFSNPLEQNTHALRIENPQYQTVVDYKLKTHGRVKNPV